MSTSEIIAELPRLTPGELALLRSKVDEVLRERKTSCKRSFFAACLQAAKTSPDTPPDFSENVDAYLYGNRAEK